MGSPLDKGHFITEIVILENIKRLEKLIDNNYIYDKVTKYFMECLEEGEISSDDYECINKAYRLKTLQI